MTTASIISTAIGAVITVILIVVYMVAYYYQIKCKVMAQINGAVDDAEASGDNGAEKKAAVVAALRDLIPAIFKPILTEERLNKIVQIAFDSIESYAKKQATKNGKHKGGGNG